MDVLTSAEFRKTYAKLTKATRVTANGHEIGTWIPDAATDEFAGQVVKQVVEAATAKQREAVTAAGMAAKNASAYNTRPFTPVPKK